MFRTKTNRRTYGEQYTRSNAATARTLTLVKPEETLILARDWLNTNERQEMVTSTITLLNTIYRQNIKSTGTVRHILRILQTTRLSSTQFRKLVYLEQTKEIKESYISFSPSTEVCVCVCVFFFFFFRRIREQNTLTKLKLVFEPKAMFILLYRIAFRAATRKHPVWY